MSDALAQVLILDDGELDDLCALLDDLGADYRRLRGGDIEDGIEPPLGLLVATPRRASAVQTSSPRDASADRPLRVISTVEDSTPMREMLRRQGYDLLVRRPTHREVWRLLVQRALYQGSERRGGERFPVGSLVEMSGEATRAESVLVDLSNRGAHLVTSQALELGDGVSLSLPADAGDGAPLALRGRVVRSAMRGPRCSVGILFDRDLSESTRQRLGSLLNSWSHGEESVSAADDVESLPACESQAIPGLTLDDETDPAIPANLQVELEGPVAGAERRRHRRGPFVRAIEAVAVGDGETAVLMGRDLSPGGMRIEPLSELGVGDCFEIAIYGPDRPEPYRVSSEVVRDDGEVGLALAFRDVPPDVAMGLEKIVACLPDIESLQEGEAAGLGAVITEIVRRRRDA